MELLTAIVKLVLNVTLTNAMLTNAMLTNAILQLLLAITGYLLSVKLQQEEIAINGIQAPALHTIQVTVTHTILGIITIVYIGETSAEPVARGILATAPHIMEEIALLQMDTPVIDIAAVFAALGQALVTRLVVALLVVALLTVLAHLTIAVIVKHATQLQ